MTLPAFIDFTRSAETKCGALAPGIRTAPINMSASLTANSISLSKGCLAVTFCPISSSRTCLSRFGSNTSTFAPKADAICVAPEPAMPPPKMTTFPLSVPATPPSNIPLPP